MAPTLMARCTQHSNKSLPSYSFAQPVHPLCYCYAESAQDTLLEPAVLHPVHSVPQQRGRALWSKATAPFKYHGGQVMTSNVSYRTDAT